MQTCGEQSHGSQWAGLSAIQMLLSPARAQHIFEGPLVAVCADSWQPPCVVIAF